MKRLKKTYSGMNTAELAAVTRKYDEDFVFESGKPLSATDRKRHTVARRRGRPRIGLGAEKVRVTIEKSLLREADLFARAKGLSRSELIARGLRAILAAG